MTVKPSVEEVAHAIYDCTDLNRAVLEDAREIAEAVLALIGGRTEAEVKANEQTRILGGLLRLPITRTQAWDKGWYSVSITDAISVVRDERCNGRDPGYEGTCPLPLNHLGGCFNDSWADA